MRIAFIAILMTCTITGTHPAAPVNLSQGNIVDAGFFEKLDQMIPALSAKFSHDAFVVDTVIWDEALQELAVDARTTNQKGTLITLTGIPSSTMVDAFQISSDYSVNYRVPLTEGQAVPCQVVIRSAFATQTIDVENAPSGCQTMFQVSGTLAVSTTSAMANGWVTVTVDDMVFATIADDSGAYELDVYSESSDAQVSITAAGKVDNQESVVHVYDGSMNELLDPQNLSAFTWAVEIYGRRHFRLIFA